LPTRHTFLFSCSIASPRARKQSVQRACNRSLSSLPVYLTHENCSALALAHTKSSALEPLPDEVVVGPPQHVLEASKLFVRDDAVNKKSKTNHKSAQMD
jgi:hypothetical protein